VQGGRGRGACSRVAEAVCGAGWARILGFVLAFCGDDGFQIAAFAPLFTPVVATIGGLRDLLRLVDGRILDISTVHRARRGVRRVADARVVQRCKQIRGERAIGGRGSREAAAGRRIMMHSLKSVGDFVGRFEGVAGV
jgi:hypothetical protein